LNILVCGGRDYSDRAHLKRVLNQLVGIEHDVTLICGMAPGADTLAHDWAIDRSFTVKPYYADWKTHGRKAGPIRNQEMLDKGRPDLVVAFPGGRGTDDMVRRAVDQGGIVLRVEARKP
jgi:hypothetical protein